MSKLQQVVASQLATIDIVYRNGTGMCLMTYPVEQHNGCATAAQCARIVRGVPNRHKQDASNTLLLEDPEVMLLFQQRVVGVAQNDDVAALAGGRLRAARNFSKKWVRDVEHHQTDTLGGAHAQMTR